MTSRPYVFSVGERVSLNSLVLRCDGTVTEVDAKDSLGRPCVRVAWDEHEGPARLVLPQNIRPVTPPRVA